MPPTCSDVTMESAWCDPRPSTSTIIIWANRRQIGNCAMADSWVHRGCAIDANKPTAPSDPGDRDSAPFHAARTPPATAECAIVLIDAPPADLLSGADQSLLVLVLNRIGNRCVMGDERGVAMVVVATLGTTPGEGLIGGRESCRRQAHPVVGILEDIVVAVEQ
jgi:hypothetical protein